MAQQKGVLQFTGGLGNLTFYRTKEGYAARMKGGVSAERIANDPKFIRTRENGQEFARAGKAVKVFRKAFIALIPKGEARLVGRMLKALMPCIKADTVSARGERVLQTAALYALAGFEFNRYSNLNAALKAPIGASVDRANGVLSVSIPAFEPEKLIGSPAGATHFRIVAGGAAIDFATEVCENGTAATVSLPVNAMVAANTLSIQISAASTAPIFVALGVQFYQQVNGVDYSLNNGSSDALAIIAVDV
jgi:hypothetical protein